MKSISLGRREFFLLASMILFVTGDILRHKTPDYVSIIFAGAALISAVIAATGKDSKLNRTWLIVMLILLAGFLVYPYL
jgi:hypothetical protein